MLRLPAPRRSPTFLIACGLLATIVSVADGAGAVDTALSAAPPISMTVTADDGPGIQPALDQVGRRGGGIVFLPAGVYRITDGIGIPSDVALVGEGMDRTIVRWGSKIQSEDFVHNGTTDGDRNVQIRDLTLDGEGRASKDKSCCYGLRFRNVSDAVVANVAADGHSKDGFHFGYVLRDDAPYGVTNSRLTGCRARGNGRNGISLTHGDGNVIDNCEVAGNGRTERVAGIDIEPDHDNVVNNNKIVGNRVSGENVGLQLFVKFNGYARVANNAVCYNRLAGNGTGLYDFKGSKNVFVENETDDNILPFRFHDANPQTGPGRAEACALAAVPPPPAVPTPTPTATATSISASSATPTPTPPATLPPPSPPPVDSPPPLLRP